MGLGLGLVLGPSSGCACSTVAAVASWALGDEGPCTPEACCNAHTAAAVLAADSQRGAAACSGRARWNASKKSKGVAGPDCAEPCVEPGALTTAASSAAIGSGALAGTAAASSAAIGSAPLARSSPSLSGLSDWDRCCLGGLLVRLRLLLRRLPLRLRLRSCLRRSCLRRSTLSRLGLLLGLRRRRGMRMRAPLAAWRAVLGHTFAAEYRISAP